jgi:hypothetical protein
MNERKRKYFFWKANFDINYSFIFLKIKQFFSHMIHMHAFYPPSRFYDKRNTTSQSKCQKIKKSKLERFNNTKSKLKL